ncbi:MAG: UDP-N-acetylmuramoyl-tripeptide--D-alanyl-D-alanine ligase [Clostridiales bacterium]|nr:UDP-N-acetylmuramoyl-tripeptide--D-alanyl-D-alanine ligase [Clostridiales bacterium]
MTEIMLPPLLCSSVLVWQAARSRRFFHMLQLNSYRNERYRLWLRRSRGEGRLLLSLAALAPILLLPVTALWTLLTAALFCAAALAVLLIRPAEKKPFVVTDRVRRQFGTAFFVLLIAGLLATLLPRAFTLPGALQGRFGAARLSAALLALLPPALLPPLCNRLNQGWESRIAQGFIDQAMAKLASKPDLTVIGITGSYGKTSMKYILAELLSERYDTLMTPESYNTPMGVVRTINEQLRPKHRMFVCEMGARQVGDIREICDIVKPTYGILTSVGIAHLETFRTTDNILKTKLELAEALPPGGLAFLNVDSAPLRNAGYDRPKVTYGLTDDCDYHASDISYSEQGTSFLLHRPQGEPLALSTRLLGRHNVLNITGAAALALTLQVPPEKISFALRRLQPVPHRLELKKNGPVIVIDDAYNANPEGAAEALAVLGSLANRTRIMVSPGIVELGDREQAANRALGRVAAQHCDYVIAVGRMAPHIIAGLDDLSFDPTRRFEAKNLREALAMLPPLMQGPSALLLENDLTDDLEKA